MKKNLVVLAALLVLCWSGSPASAADKAAIGTAKKQGVAAPVDFRACTFRPGKTMADLDAVAAKFRAYANQNDLDYAAWIIVPEYRSGEDFDVGWLGAWPDGEAFGLSMEKWKSTGRALQAEFATVMDCSKHHEMASSLPINAADATPQDGIMLVYQCSLAEGRSVQDAYAAHLKWGTAKKSLGFLDNSWLFQPAAGLQDSGFDYYHIVVFYRYSDLGAAIEEYANGGGKKTRDDIYAGVTDCGLPFIYDFISVRDRDER